MTINKIIFSFLISVGINSYAQETKLHQKVNPFIGTGGHGHTFPGAVLPFGMVQLSPDTRIDGSWDGCGGYHYSDSIIYGFSHTHLSGTGVSDWGDILIIPSNENKGHGSKKYATKFKHQNENAHAGYYAVKLNNNIQAELTTTERVGIHRYHFPNENAFIYIDLLHRDKVLNCQLTQTDSFTIKGYRISEAWAKEQHCYFTLTSNKAIKKFQSKAGVIFDATKNFEQKPITEGAILEFDNASKEPLLLKVALSNVDNNGSTNNLTEEAKHWNFNLYKKSAEEKWDKQLSKIKITEPNSDKQFIFYTALYHCFIHPSLDMDVDKRYRGIDHKIYVAENFTHHNVFSLWDTYRALHPLFTIIEQQRTNDFINTFQKHYQQINRLPVWELSSNETNCMIGYHAVSVITDAYIKGIKNYDTTSIFKAAKASAKTDMFGISTFYAKRFLEINDESESVSKSLEYAYDNWCIAQMGKKMGMYSEIPQLLTSAQAYKNLFDASTGFMRPRLNGNWYSPFNPTEINNHFTEGNSWHYSFYVPHDVKGLINLHGSENKFEAKLDELFSTNAKTTGRDQVDVTGLIGQYAHGNEPSHHAPFLYHYIGKPYKTYKKVNQILNTFYQNSPDGLIGNDDCGQMSAWYVLSAMGLYQVCPGDPTFVVFQPQFEKTEIQLENGTNAIINAKLNTKETISNLNVNGALVKQSYVSFATLTDSCVINFEYEPLINSDFTFGKSNNMRPQSVLNEFPIVPTPIIEYKNKAFSSNTTIKLKAINSKTNYITYTKNGKAASKNAIKYINPFSISVSTRINAKAFSKNDSSINIQANLFRLNTQLKVVVKSTANKQYSADGPQSLVDNVFGDIDWRKGEWLGYQGQDFECLIENKTGKLIKQITANFLQDTRSWIIFPTQVLYYASADGINYQLLNLVKSTVHANNYIPQTQRFSISLDKPQIIKHLKVVAKNYGKLPEWHEGKGAEAFIFIDEIELK